MQGWVPVADCPNGLWAALLRSYLEARGMPVWIENEHSQGVWGGGLLTQVPNPAVGSLRLWVPAARQAEAEALIEDFFS